MQLRREQQNLQEFQNNYDDIEIARNEVGMYSLFFSYLYGLLII